MNGPGAAEGTPKGGQTAAFFDVDGTLASSNVVEAFLDYRLSRLPRWRRWGWLAFFASRLPYYAALDTIDRSRFNEVFFRNYAGVPQQELEQWARGAVQGFWMPRLFPRGMEQLHRHRQQGHRIILVAGGLEAVLRPLASWLEVDSLVGTGAEVKEQRLTGGLLGGPMAGPAKADATRRIAAAMGIDLMASYAYADSHHDGPFLSCVGHPIAVNPDWRLRRMALRQGWPICLWRHPEGSRREGWRRSLLRPAVPGEGGKRPW